MPQARDCPPPRPCARAAAASSAAARATAMAAAPRPSRRSRARGHASLPALHLCARWPEPIRVEALALPCECWTLPARVLALGLAKGRSSFTWGQIRPWMPRARRPPRPRGDGAQLPAQGRRAGFSGALAPGPRRQGHRAGRNHPGALHGGSAAEDASPPRPRLRTLAADRGRTPPRRRRRRSSRFASELAPPSHAPADAAPEAPALRRSSRRAPAEPLLRAARPNPRRTFRPAGTKAHWSPQEMIERTVRLPGVAGAIVALQEGLVVAANLPEEMKGDTVAAFLPQIFARLNHYAGEMKLGGGRRSPAHHSRRALPRLPPGRSLFRGARQGGRSASLGGVAPRRAKSCTAQAPK